MIGINPMVRIDVEKLDQMAQETMASEESYHFELLNRPKYNYKKESYKEFIQRWDVWNERMCGLRRAYEARWDMLEMSCDMVGADINKIVASVKAIRRQEKKLDWERCFTLKDEHIRGIMKEEETPWNKGLLDMATPMKRCLP